MGKRTLNPMDEFRRQKRKKEIAKNKTSRISARDERVKETKTVREVEQSIQDLEKRGTKTPGEQQKLQRLQKELKLVKAAESTKVATIDSKSACRLTELDDPRKSVYYDEILNPYGAPPPGKPRLYHRRGGGQTMDMSDAVVPGEETPPPPSSPQPHQPCLLQHPQRSTMLNSNTKHLSSNAASSQSQMQPPPPPPLPPSAPPPLPPPSSAVQRTKRTTLAADIWASTEEVSYERIVKCNDLEDSTATMGWWYRDNFQHIQGPFAREQIQEWSRGGFFPPNTPVKQGDKGKWWTMGDMDWTTGERKQQPVKANSIDDRIHALRKKSTTCDDDAMQQPQRAESGTRVFEPSSKTLEGDDEVVLRIGTMHEEVDEANNEDGIAADMAAMRQPPNPLDSGASRDQQDHTTFPVPEVDDGVAGRIEMLRRQRTDGVDSDGGIAARIAVLRQPQLSYENLLPQSQPMDTMVEPPAYPIDETSLYPVEDDLVYPGVNSCEDYPVVDAYPSSDGEYPTDIGYSADKGYPMAGKYSDATAASPKQLLVVRDLVPSHLQRRKGRTNKDAPKPTKVQQQTITPKSVGDEYDKFMEEISGLT